MQNLFGDAKSMEIVRIILLYSIVIVGAYLVMFRPNQKRKKQEDELRKSIQIGDEIVTIGGIVGKVVSIKEDSDSLVIETASEKMRIKKWAIASKENQETK